MVAVRNAFGVLLLAVALWLLERVLPASLSLALWGVLAAGVALWLGALEFTLKTHRQKLAQLLGLMLLVYAIATWVGALRGENRFPCAHWGTLGQNATNSPATKAEHWQTITTPAELSTALAAAKAAKQPLLLDWYADWCISCKVIEREVLNAPEVTAQLGDYRLIRFDMSASNAEQRALLDGYQLFGPPAILFFAPNGDEWRDLRVVGEVDAPEFARRLQVAASKR